MTPGTARLRGGLYRLPMAGMKGAAIGAGAKRGRRNRGSAAMQVAAVHRP